MFDLAYTSGVMLPNPAIIKVEKLDVAKRQLNTAVRAFFNGTDPIAVHTLVGAGANIASDLAEHRTSRKSWDNRCAQDNRLTKAEYFRIAREAQNFFKHAVYDPSGELDFDQRDTETLLMMASLNLGELNQPGETHSIELSVFQLWYIARWSAIWKPDDRAMEPLLEDAGRMFPGFEELSRDEQIRRGNKVLELELSKRQHKRHSTRTRFDRRTS